MLGLFSSVDAQISAKTESPAFVSYSTSAHSYSPTLFPILRPVNVTADYPVNEPGRKTIKT